MNLTIISQSDDSPSVIIKQPKSTKIEYDYCVICKAIFDPSELVAGVCINCEPEDCPSAA